MINLNKCLHSSAEPADTEPNTSAVRIRELRHALVAVDKDLEVYGFSSDDFMRKRIADALIADAIMGIQ